MITDGWSNIQLVDTSMKRSNTEGNERPTETRKASFTPYKEKNKFAKQHMILFTWYISLYDNIIE